MDVCMLANFRDCTDLSTDHLHHVTMYRPYDMTTFLTSKEPLLQLRQQSTIEAWILDVVFYFLQMELPDRRRKRGRPRRICGCSEGGRAKTWFDKGG